MNPTNSKTIICYDVPPTLLHKSEAKRYFKTFGSIIKIIVKTKSRKCIVEYETAEAAQEACCLGGEYEGIEFPIEFQLKPTATKQRTQKAKKETDPDWDMDEDVKAELEAMGMSSNYSLGKKQYNLRPEKMTVDAELSTIIKKATRADRVESKKRSVDTTAKKSTIQASTERELLNILKQHAENTEDKYRMLDARDKLIRLRRFKNVDIHMLGVTVGTCPDMCPEKERLMREVQHQVALYEAAGDRSMNHSVAVKQYSRSSADQEAPLPHELRGVEVLQMTMGYLMHRIMRLADSPDCNLGEWYHFLWDRMRGIRKDITQQELCCTGSVQLVEQCARFHVHCSARLVAEDAAVFDQKINTENLTKCLQTLKYMYNDLTIKGERCPDEAEFRAYVILLNLNDGNFMWEVQQLPVDIQKSAEIKFALDVYSSLDKNNFVKFFKLVRQTTYLNACILLRYFVQVRTKAIRTIAKCYTPRLPQAQFPVSQLTTMLAFEGVTACVDFVQFCGLTITSDRSYVILNKRDITDSDVPYALDRAIKVIESKRNCALGEVVYGETLPPPIFDSHIPQNSFTDAGYLKNLSDLDVDFEPLSSKDEVDKSTNLFKIKERSNSPFGEGGSSSKEAWSVASGNTFTHTLTPKPIGNLFAPITKATSFPITPQRSLDIDREQAEEAERLRRQQEEAQKEKEAEAERRRHQQELLAQKEKLQERQQQMRAALEQERLEFEKRLEQQRNEQRQLLEAARVKAEQLRAEAERQQQQRLAAEKQRQEREKAQQEEAQRQKIREDAHRQQVAIQAQVEANEIRTVVHSVVNKLVADVTENCRKIRLNELKHNSLARIVLQKWRTKVHVNRRKRKAIDLGPLWANEISTEEMAKELFTSHQNPTLNLMKRYKKGVVAGSLEGKYLPSVIKLGAQTLKDLTANHLLRNSIKTKKLQNDIFWKVDVFFEDNCEIVRRTMDEAIGWDHTKVFLKRVKVNQNNFTYCLQKTALSDEAGVFDNMNGLVVVMRELNEDVVDKLLKYLNSLGDLECMPVCFILEEENDSLRKEVEIMVTNRLISEIEWFVCDFTPENLGLALGRALSVLSQNYRPPPPLLLNTLRAFLGDNLGGEFFQRVRAFAKWNLPFKHCVSKPNVAIGLFNQGLDRLESIILNEERCEHAAFPDIFKQNLTNEIPDYLPCDYKYFPTFWKKEAYNTSLKTTLTKFRLPEYNGEWPLEAGPELESNILDYCQTVCDNDAEAQKLFLKVGAKLLRASENGTQSWIDVAEVILEHNLKTINFSLPSEYKSRTIFNQLIVVYQCEHLQRYINDAWFYLKNSLVQSEIDVPTFTEQPNEDRYEVFASASFDVEPEETVIDLDVELKRAFEPSEIENERHANAKKCKAALDDFRFLLNDLEESMKIQRVISEKFQANLKRCLDSP